MRALTTEAPPTGGGTRLSHVFTRGVAPLVTVVIATYNRPDLLRLTLEGLFSQSCSAWHAIIIGDHCTASTGDMIAALRHPNIRYINLPVRCGEQALPNSVGLMLANSEYVAFLNHDDLWLPDHLAHAIDSLAIHSADLFTARAAFAVSHPSSEGYSISEISPPDRTLPDAFMRPFYLFEPISGWVLRRAAALRVGAFTPAMQLYRTPLEDWLLRAWRCGLAHVDGGLVTVLKDNTYPAAVYRQTYRQPKVAVRQALDRLASASPDQIRQEFTRMLDLAHSEGLVSRDFISFPPTHHARLALQQGLTRQAAIRFFETGQDTYEEIAAQEGLERAPLLRHALMWRVGERLPEPPALNELLEFARTRDDEHT